MVSMVNNGSTDMEIADNETFLKTVRKEKIKLSHIEIENMLRLTESDVRLPHMRKHSR
jgi:hypothetical protein